MWQFWLRSAFAVLMGAASQWAIGAATVVDLTPIGSSATVNGAIFRIPSVSIDASGTGVIDAFLRVQNTPFEQGYNSSDRPVQFDEDNGATTHNHDLTIADLSTNKVKVGGIEYYEFVMDSHESQGGLGPLLSLDKFELFKEPSGTNTATCAGRYTPETAGGTVTAGTMCGLQAVYSLDGGPNGTGWTVSSPGSPSIDPLGDYSIKLDSSNFSGSGQLDMVVLVPTALFGVVAPTDKVYLYSRFGDLQSTSATFEEWARKTTGTFTVPIPGTLLLFGAGLLVLGAVRRRIRA